MIDIEREASGLADEDQLWLRKMTSMISAVGIQVVGTLSDAHDFSLT